MVGLLWAQAPSSVWSGVRLEGFLDPESLRMAGLRKLRASLNVPLTVSGKAFVNQSQLPALQRHFESSFFYCYHPLLPAPDFSH